MTAPEHQHAQPDPLPLLGPTVIEALAEIDIPIYVLDLAGTLRWANHATTGLIGDRCGCSYLSFVAADSRDRAKEQFARKIVGGFPTSYEIAVTDAAGRRVPLKVRGAPLRSPDRVVGILGLAVPVDDGLVFGAGDQRPLTPRQVEILRMLAEAASTQEMASRLGIAPETVRNHIRGLFRRLDAHNRLEAVAAARRRGLLRGEGGE